MKWAAAALPDLQRFYGGSPAAWLRTPAWLLDIYSEAVTRIQARESLRLANADALGSGTMKKSDARKLGNQLQREAGRGRKAVRGLGYREVAAMHGIGVIDG